MSEILLKTIDQSKLEAIQDKYWLKCLEAQPLDSNDSSLDPFTPRIERASTLPQEYSSTIGGLCSIFTGDLELPNPSILRMDQLVEAVGLVDGKTPFIIIEDSFFSSLTGIDTQKFTDQGLEATERIKRWFQTFSPNSEEVNFAFTSNKELAEGMEDLVRTFSSEMIQNPNFAKIQAAPILLMYTGLWPKLLSNLGYLADENTICVEPVVHFVGNRTFPQAKLSYAYENFLEWLKVNPYAKTSSKNINMGIAGFWESRSPKSFQRTRLQTSNQVPNTNNWQEWNEKLSQEESAFPFPLRNNIIFTEAVNWGLVNQEVREQLSTIVNLENEYYQIKQNTPLDQRSPAWARKNRSFYQQQANTLIKDLSRQTQEILSNVLGDL